MWKIMNIHTIFYLDEGSYFGELFSGRLTSLPQLSPLFMRISSSLSFSNYHPLTKRDEKRPECLINALNKVCLITALSLIESSSMMTVDY